MKKFCGAVAAVAAAIVLGRGGTAEAMDVGSLVEVRQNVYGVPPEGSEAAKHRGDTVAFQERLETLEDSGALVRFVDDSKLSLGAKSKVLIDEFVFDPAHAKGNALIEISAGTLRWVTGDMPKGGTVIKTPTATLVLRGTDVVVHVHPDGTTDTTVYDGKVEAHNNLTNQVTTLDPGDGATLGRDGTTSHDQTDNGDDDTEQEAANGQDNPPEHRRSDSMRAQRPEKPEATSSSSSDDSDGDGDDGDDCGCN